MGRRKIEIKMVKDTNTRQVTFSKRRTGLFKKANELSILCGTEVAIVVFSPGNKPYSFGHPDVQSVAAKFLEQEPRSNGPSSCDTNIIMLNQQLSDVMNQLHEEEKKGKFHDEALKQCKKNQIKELQELHDLAMELKSNIKSRLDEIEAVETMLMIKEQPVEFDENHVSKRKRRKI
ncbi:PREDICTED: agamous-like MADS-box protein AGL29 [Lupinus angustifolius]|uniref:agamous-like MADS-box protein AGL29 n=1 Tax=Lupinus angustifolius TaxID=3871 RepID=UPI00092FC1B0|nr:PREDICTED: agamous-like MADS-box protein AGL29 [Lupinus angustifolius]